MEKIFSCNSPKPANRKLARPGMTQELRSCRSSGVAEWEGSLPAYGYRPLSMRDEDFRLRKQFAMATA